jgi:multiple sugar transport system substrate-binding protein
MKRLWLLATIVVLFSLMVTACAAPNSTSAPTGETAGAEASTGEVRDFVSWYQYDQNNEDPASDERVGNEYLRQTIPLSVVSSSRR